MPVNSSRIKCLLILVTCTIYAKCSDSNQIEYLDYNFNRHGVDDYYFKYLTTSSEFEFTDVEPKLYKSKCRQDADCKHTGGTCLKGKCVRVCSTHANGSRCDYYHCDGKSALASSDSTGSLIETNGQPLLEYYLSQKKCSWILRNLNSGFYKDVLNDNLSAEFAPFIQLEIERFGTQFGNDYLYIFAGDSVFSPLVAALSGDEIASDEPSLAADNEHDELNSAVKSKFKINFFNTSNLFVLFKSDIYSASTSGSFLEPKPSGISIKYRFSSSCTDQLITNVENTICYNSINQQLHTTKNISSNTQANQQPKTSLLKTITHFETDETRIEGPLDSRLRRAFHCSFTHKNFHYIIGGYSSLPNNISLISRLNLNTFEWSHDADKTYKPINRSSQEKLSSNLNFVPHEIDQQIPDHRYGHGCVLDEQNNKLFMYGGIKYNHRALTKPFDTQFTNELWSYDLQINKWTLLNDETSEKVDTNKNYILPVAVSGHSLAFIRNEDNSSSLLIFFGFSEYYGSTVNIIQEYNLVSRSWRLHTTFSHTVNLGFAHTINHDVRNNQIYLHGGLNIDNNLANGSSSPPGIGHMYNYDLNTRKWTEKAMLSEASFMHSSTLYENKIVTFGGVVFDVDTKTNKTHKIPKISNTLNVFDINSNKWYTKPLGFKHRQRHSHSSFIHNDHLYIFGGFNGFFLRDLFKIDLSLALDEISTKKKRQIIYPINGSGPIMLQEPLREDLVQARKVSRSKSFDKNQLFLGIVELCNIYKSCSSCQSNINCIWNNKQCEYYSASSLSSNVTERVIYKKPTCTNMCNEAGTCSNCTANAACIWCASESRCLLKSAVQAYFPFGSCIDFVGETSRCEKPVRDSSLVHYIRSFEAVSTSMYSACQVRYSNCSSCISDERCGWCSLDTGLKNIGASNSGVGVCMEGSYLKANDEMKCGANWFFTQCPSCECNGHSTCSKKNVTNSEQVARICTKCLNNTRGMNCQECTRGYFGNPENNGTCKSCNCGAHSDFCDGQTGRCFCNTKGVVGSKCDRCETPRYTGMPSLPDGSCYYNLSTDYQFTFNLNKAADRFYNRINFVNQIQDDIDDDIDFMIRCFKSDAVFNVTFMVDYDPSLAPNNLDWPFSLFSNITNYIFYKNKTEYVLSIAKNTDKKTDRSSLGYYMGNEAMKTLMLAQVNCSDKEFRYTFSNKEFRDKHNSTFLVHVFGFEVPITVQISFSRRSRIQLLHFFITFFGCLFSLLAIAFITWKSKQRYDQYRHQRQVVIQMEHMASRPFTKLLIDVTKVHSEYKSESNLIQHNVEALKTDHHSNSNHVDSRKGKSKLCSRINKKNLLRRSSKNLTNLELHGQQLEAVPSNSSNQNYNPLPEVMPVAVEPLSNNKTAVLTCVLKLPQGGLSHTPKGSSPIILASTYVMINSSTSFSKPQYDSNTDSIMLDDDEEALKKDHPENV